MFSEENRQLRIVRHYFSLFLFFPFASFAVNRFLPPPRIYNCSLARSETTQFGFFRQFSAGSENLPERGLPPEILRSLDAGSLSCLSHACARLLPRLFLIASPTL